MPDTSTQGLIEDSQRSVSTTSSPTAGQGTLLDSPPNASEKSLADLLKDLSEGTSNLVRQELELARVELVAKGKRLAVGGGMLGGAGLLAVLASGALVASAIAAVAIAIPVWAAALVVAVLLLIASGGLAAFGKADVQRGSPPIPENAVESTKEDVTWLKSRMRSGKP